ncbi:histidine kinase [Paenibacillus sp. Root52]|uniref:histidine kinase n=1 Tax=Paenibacillus amylolyticus TaxID=1451 RepID=A0AAP5H4L5_PAEAM|nr:MULTISPECIES: HAMP domain-containing sensor histidine kinase [Paenibacillus]KQY94865.1 histidine kinase [Paenibacillus sp. Root52]MDR6723826.1 signal transduction histidine kinase [Paenibacillus amylolyticus]
MKRLWKTREKRPLHTSLTLDFLLFNFFLLLLVLVVYIIVSLDVVDFRISDHIVDPDLNVEAHVYVAELEKVSNQDGSDITSSIETQRLEDSGGWLEILNADRSVIRSVGNKKDTINQYAESELFAKLENRSDQPYYYSISPFMAEGEATYLLLKLPRDLVSIRMNDNQLITNLKHPLPFYILVGIGLLLVLTIVYSYWVAKRIKKPLRVLSLGLTQMIRGNYSTRMSISAEKEFVQIGETFNFMADVIEKTSAEKRYAEESKQRLIVDLSHDLKTPITSIQGYAQALVEGRVGDAERQQRYLGYIHNKSVQVARMIQNMLELLKVDSPDFHMNIKQREIGEFVREIMADTYGEIEQNQFVLHVLVPDEEIYARYDPELLSRVIQNLITNALAYNPRGTELRVELIPQETYVSIEVADTGVGIPQELWATIFDPFVRGDAARSGTGGTGLGLAIAKRNTEKMGGHLTLSQRGRETTIFTIVIPK